MVADVGHILNTVQQKQLTAIQRTVKAQAVVQLRLASGKNVRSALDDPDNFFIARSLDNRANDLERLLDGIGKSIQTIKQAQNAIQAIDAVLNTADSFLTEYEKDLAAGNIAVKEILDTDFFIPFDDVNDFINYSGAQDSGVQVTLIENGFGVRLDDNSWRRLSVNYTVTSETIIEFDFLSTNIPEIAAIGFDNDNTYTNNNNFFFLYGQQTNGISYSAPIATYQYDGSGEWVHVQIPVGTYFTGTFSHLTFIDDDDGGGNDGDAQFRNFVIHEGDYTYGQTNLTVADIYEEKYAALMDQIDLIANDAIYRGINLLEGDSLTTHFNEYRTSRLIIDGLEASSAALGLVREDFTTIEAVQEKISQVRNARETLRKYAQSLALDFGILNNRAAFTANMINVLQEGRDDLTLSDQNQDGAALLALETRRQIQISVLAASRTTIADFLT